MDLITFFDKIQEKNRKGFHKLQIEAQFRKRKFVKIVFEIGNFGLSEKATIFTLLFARN